MSKITIDVEGEPQRLALAWAAGAGAAGAYWPSAFGAAVARLPFFSPARRWLREAIRLADQYVGDIRLLELEVGASGPGPRYADSWTTDDDGCVHLEWETSVSLVLSSLSSVDDRLRLIMYGEHLHREDAVREWLARPDTRRAIKDWREIVDGPAQALLMTDSERALLSEVSEERLEVLAAYNRLLQTKRRRM